jgi:hypothetical protein
VVPVSAASPDGRHVALVRNHPDIDPPHQSIWLRSPATPLHQIKQLAPDLDWCNAIAWSADSSTVAYLVQDARLITVDARLQQIVSDQWLTPRLGDYPPSRMVVELTLTGDGTGARFRMCKRGMFRARYVFHALDCGALQSVRIRPRPA